MTSSQVGKLCGVGQTVEHDLSSFTKLLIYPTHLLYASVEIAAAVPIEVRAKLIPAWTKLLETVAVAIVNTPKLSVTMNEFIVMVINKLVVFLQEREAEVGVAYEFNQSVMVLFWNRFTCCVH